MPFMAIFAMASCEKAVMLCGTSCTFSSRLVPVTTTSSMALSAGWAWACAVITEATAIAKRLRREGRYCSVLCCEAHCGSVGWTALLMAMPSAILMSFAFNAVFGAGS
jgi:hypothetical protein